MIIPPYLTAGDIVAICSPAGAVSRDLFAPAVNELERRGYRVKLMPHAMGQSGSYSGSANHRLSDMTHALLDPEVKAIMCGRGGYGAIHLLSDLEPLVDANNPKWLIGFSDITALHALWNTKGIASVHASMLKGIVESPPVLTDYLFNILEGKSIQYEWYSHPLNRPGNTEGYLMGGNLSVLGGILGTPYTKALSSDTPRILLIEDVNEPIYKIERILWQLRYAGILSNLSGLIAGNFTGSKADKNYDDVYSMIVEMVAEYSYPVALDVPVGHIAHNHPLLLGPCKICVQNSMDMKCQIRIF